MELYNAVNGTNYDNPDDIIIFTIDDALYLGMKNDVAFLIFSYMNLFEHQSTPNPNMPVRGLLYFAKLYEKYIKLKRLRIHSSTQVKLPTPRYIVFYNGIQERPEKEELRLTTAFDKPEESSIEVKATVLNVNYGKNRKLMKQAQTLEEYAQFIAAVRRYGKELPPEAAIDKAVTECIDKGILAEYLLARKAEVHEMLLTEYNEAEVQQEFWEAGREEGRKEGKEEGREEGREEGKEEGREVAWIYFVLRMLSKGKDAEQIADELEEDVDKINEIVDAIREVGEDATAEDVWRHMHSKEIQATV